jgi:predicted nucleotidyltransferase
VIKEPYSTIIEKLLRLLKERFGDDLISIAVYGSIARGDYRNDSDIDLLIIARNLPFSITERIKIFDSIEALLEEDILAKFKNKLNELRFERVWLGKNGIGGKEIINLVKFSVSMNNKSFAKSHLRQAEERIKH